jgi:hypothetical protein
MHVRLPVQATPFSTLPWVPAIDGRVCSDHAVPLKLAASALTDPAVWE